MLEWLLVVVTLVLFLAGISVHELGHALACRRADVPVKEICLLGWPIPRVSGLTLPIRSRWFPETRWTIQPLPLGAYMVPDEARMKEVTRRSRIDVLAMGPIASCLYGLVLLALGSLAAYLAEQPISLPTDDADSIAVSPGMHLMIAGVCLVVAAVLYAWRHFRVIHGLLLLVGILLMPLFAWVIYEMIREAILAVKPWHEIFPGPFALTFMIKDFLSSSIDPLHHRLFQPAALVLWIAGGLSILIGLLNMAPLVAGDGTMIIMEFLPQPIARWIWRTTVAVVVGFIALSIVGDALWIASKLRE